MERYNDPAAVNDRMAAVAARHDAPEKAAAFATLAREPLTRRNLTASTETAERAVAAGKRADQLDSIAAPIIEKMHTVAPGTPEYEKLQAQLTSAMVGKLGTVKGMEAAQKNILFGEQAREFAVKRNEDAWFNASRTEDGAVKHYNDNYKDGSTAKVVADPKTGVRQLVRTDAEGRETPLGKPYKDWGTEGRGQVLGNLMSFAKEEYKLGLTHRFKVEEIREQGKQHVAYAKAITASKEVRMTPDQKERLTAAAKAVHKASSPDDYDPKKFAAARHQFNGIVREIGVENKNFGMIPDDRAGKAPSEISIADAVKLREQVIDTIDPKLKGADREAAITRGMGQVIEVFRGLGRVKGLDGRGGGAGAPAGGGLAALLAAAENKNPNPVGGPAPVGGLMSALPATNSSGVPTEDVLGGMNPGTVLSPRIGDAVDWWKGLGLQNTNAASPWASSGGR